MKILFVSAQLQNVIESSPSITVTLKPLDLEYCGTGLCVSFVAESIDEAAKQLFEYFTDVNIDRAYWNYKVIFDSPIVLRKTDGEDEEIPNANTYTGLLKQKFYQLFITNVLSSTSKSAQSIGEALKLVGEELQ